jgi:hypothetical protein
MPPISVLTLALLGGFILVSNWYPTKYYILRSDGYRLVFASSIAGVVLYFLAAFLSYQLAGVAFFQSMDNWWHEIFPVTVAANSGKAALSFILGITLWMPSNFIGWLSSEEGVEKINQKMANFIRWKIIQKTAHIIRVCATPFRWLLKNFYNALVCLWNKLDQKEATKNIYQKIQDFTKTVREKFRSVLLWLWEKRRWLKELSYKAAVDREILRKNDFLEIFLRDSLGKEKELISVSVKNSKVYIGKLYSTINPALPMVNIGLVLTCSGYRDKDTKQLVIDTNYEATHRAIKKKAEEAYKEAVRQQLKKDGSKNEEEIDKLTLAQTSQKGLEQFMIVIPVAEIQSVSAFSQEIYDEMKGARNSGTANEAVRTTDVLQQTAENAPRQKVILGLSGVDVELKVDRKI